MQPMSLRHNLEIMSDTLDADAKPKKRPKKRSKSTSASSSSEDEKRKKSKKRKRSTSSSSSMSEDEKQKRRAKKKAKKLKKKMKKKLKKEKRAKTKEDGDAAVDVPISLMSKSMAPMTKEEWEKQQSVVRRVYDETTGRHRLIKGDGEVIEEIVSRERHKAINEQATRGDGQHFQATLLKDMSRK